jgi:hypothetical protein
MSNCWMNLSRFRRFTSAAAAELPPSTIPDHITTKEHPAMPQIHPRVYPFLIAVVTVLASTGGAFRIT